MSNKAVPNVYRAIIDDVMANIKPDFDEMGIEKEVLDELQRSWEQKLTYSRVADFSSDARMGTLAKSLPPLPKAEQHPNGLNGIDQNVDVKPVIPRDSEATSDTTSPKQQDASAPSTSRATPAADDDEIGSDLDDPEDEEDEQAAGDDGASGDLVIALYDKVQRVKSKWKVTLKDGVISVHGKDHLFTKCNGEFDW